MKRLILLTIFAHLTIVFSALLFVRLQPQPRLALAALISTPQLIPITLTAYSPCPTQTQGHPRQMASQKFATWPKIRGLYYLAISRDLMKRLGLKWGDSIFLEFKLEDLMAASFKGKPITNSIDMFVPTEKMARDIGRQNWRRIFFVRQPAS